MSESDICLHHWFENQVDQSPEAMAVIYDDERVTYAALNHRSTQLAFHLQSSGVVEGSRVGLCLNRSVDMVVAIIAVLKSGGAYVPLDPKYPHDRLAYMLSDADPKALIVHDDLVDMLPQYDVPVICLDQH